MLGLGLLALVAVSILVARDDARQGFTLELACAALQAGLIGAFFMQLRGARPLILITAGSATVLLFSMFVLSLYDLLTRL